MIAVGWPEAQLLVVISQAGFLVFPWVYAASQRHRICP